MAAFSILLGIGNLLRAPACTGLPAEIQPTQRQDRSAASRTSSTKRLHVVATVNRRRCMLPPLVETQALFPALA